MKSLIAVGTSILIGAAAMSAIMVQTASAQPYFYHGHRYPYYYHHRYYHHRHCYGGYRCRYW
jgi:hypothetical protein